MLKHRWRYGSLKILPPPEMDPFRGGVGFFDFSSNFCRTDLILEVKVI